MVSTVSQLCSPVAGICLCSLVVPQLVQVLVSTPVLLQVAGVVTFHGEVCCVFGICPLRTYPHVVHVFVYEPYVVQVAGVIIVFSP